MSQLQYPKEPIAIVGSACRFAGGASSPNALWELLKYPRDVLSAIPPTRFNTTKFYHPDGLHSGTSNVQHSYLLDEDHRLFDAAFFGVKSVEATAIDPQQRILLEIAYEALEAAGIPMEGVRGSNTGVYVGLMVEEYSKILGVDILNIPDYFASGTARNNISNRISYFFDLNGPSMTIDTACSSSLVALHQAVLSLRAGEIDGALVAGANLILAPEQYVVSSKLRMLSPSGRSRMWDAKADGYGRGDGLGVLVLKTLSRAIADGDDVECIIRETGVNQDGRTKGLMMPNPKAQVDLIRNTYKKAGLSLENPQDRPQFFECHGTGTPTGDPIEAEAISTVFFPTSMGELGKGEESLLVGSAKTVLGHTEGSAGILGIMKASLALQHGTVPPNMLLDELNPRVQPFCSHLRIPLEAKDWPETSAGCPRRASVNSFGFGGTNAHAIIESFVGQPHNRSSPQDDDAKGECISLAPFNFSAASEPSLRSSLAAYASFLRENRGISLWDFAWTLNARRSRLPVRASFCASSAGELAEKLEEGFSGASERVTIASRIATDGHGTGRPRLLGVFTGQGAQWASMGRHLLESSKLVGSCFQSLQTALDRLAQHAPDWSLRDELLQDVAASRINDAAFSQPLCTAVQIALVQLLRATGVIFTAVVGHSSGEIAAAYAAGYLSAEDAIRIAYFRGLFLDRACAGGAMLAVGTTLEDASKLCNLRSMQGRICIAAINSPTSITLSGDSDAIQDAQEIFEDENKFTRLVKVDKAYHSHHMTPIADIYLQAIRDRGVQVQARQPGVNHPVWISSVKGEDVEGLNLDVLRGQYWRDNMRDPVVFSQAVQCALQTHGPFTAVLEVGPHPALRTPTSDTITATTGLSIPYVATLIRGQNDTEAFASALGNLWKNGMMIDLGALVQQPLKMLKNLPKYAWDHDRTFWHETRRARALRNHNGASFPHPLLGTRCEDEAEGELRFRNHLNMRDIPWLADHRIQDQVLLPGTAYICACLEAVMIAFPIDREDVRLVEFRDIVIRKALVFPEGVEGAELVLCIKLVDEDEHHIRANFQFSSSSDAVKESTVLVENCSGEVIVIRRKRSDEARRDALPPARQLAPGRTILNLQPSTFYDWARELGYGYEGCFRGLSEIRRRINTSAGRLLVPQQTMFVVHPATLDLAIQGVLLAYSCPGDGRLRSLHMPTRVDLLRIDPAACQAASKVEHLSFFSSVAPSTDLVGHVDIHVAGRTLVQIQGLHATPVNPPTADNDTKNFFEMILEPEMPMGSPVINSARFDTEHDRRTNAERVAYFYFRGLSEAFPPGARNDLQWHHVRLLEYVDSCIAKFANGTYLYTCPEWMADSEGDIDRILRRFSSVVDFKLMATANDGLVRSIHDRGQTNMWEVLTRDNMLDDYYRHGLGMPEYLNAMTNIVAQLSHRFAHMDILEVGAGTGAATGAILNRLDGAFRSFTFTDISNGFFPGASTKFAKFESQMKFQLLDIEKSVTNQGFVEGSYDLVIASLVLHATSDLAQSLANLRTLLRAGGYLIMLELTEMDVFRIGLLFGGFPGWWLGDRADGRHLSPCVSVKVWETLMQETGFSKIEAITPPDPELLAPLTILVCQAVDERIQFLRNPMMPGPQGLGLKCLTIIGGGELISAEFYTLIKRHYQVVRQLVSLADVATQELPAAGTVISLLDVVPDEVPVFQSLTEVDFSAIRKIFRLSKTILWVSRGCLHDRPYSNMFRGLARSAKLETSSLRVQTLDIDIGDPFEWQIVAQCLLKLEVIGVWEEENRLGGLLWQREPELFVRGGVVSIPRLRQSVTRNNRYNSARRFISHEVSVKENLLGIQKGVVNLKETQISTSPFGGETRLVYSLLKAVLIGTHGVFLSVGERIDTRQQVLVLSKSLESQICAPLDWSVPLSPGSDQRKALLLLQAQLLAQTIVRTIVPTRQLVVFNSDELLGDALFQLTSEKAIQLLLVTTRDVDFKRGWTRVHPYETLQTIQQMFPNRLFTFVDMAEREEDSELLRHCLPRGCKVIRRSELLMDDAELDFSPTAVRAVADHLQAAYLACTATIFDSVDLSPVPTFDLHALTMPDKINGVIKASGPGVQGIVSWLASEKVRLQIQPASSQLSFRSDRTYWLVGLTGGLGPGLCEFMADRGAAYIALSSRHPRVDEGWIRLMASRGCVVRVFENDVTDRDSLQALHSRITTSMPPIAGVAQGAMVLRDAVLPDLSYSQLRETLAPKVDGSLHLDELFSDNRLEFFIFFSSLAYVAGNPGQSAYSAANAFMASLAARRRKRGLVASVINMGGIVGEGYISRQLALGKQSALIKAGFDFQSEQAFHELFSEAVLAGRLGSEDSLEISSGLRVGEVRGVSFANNPIFQHQVFKTKTDPTIRGIRPRHNDVMKALHNARTDEEALDIIKDGVLTKFEAVLRVKLERSSGMHLSPDQLGIDSLVAVEFQSWLAKDLGVDLSVMKILNFISIGDLIRAVKDTLAPDKIPKLNLVVDGSENEASEHAQAHGTDPSFNEGTIAIIGSPSALDSSEADIVTPLSEPEILVDGSTPPTVILENPSLSTISNESFLRISSNMKFERSAPMSFAQTRFWFLKFAVENQAAFNVTTVVQLCGSLDYARFSRALVAVGQRHEAVRTAFYVDDATKEPMQGVLPHSRLHLEREIAAGNDQVEGAIQEMRRHHFDLSAGQSVRLKLVTLPKDRHVLILGYHHIALDGIGNQIFFSDLESAYNGTLDTAGADILQYPDYTLKQLQHFKRGDWQEDLQYWLDRFAVLPPSLPLMSLSRKPTRPETTQYASNSIKLHLDAITKAQVHECSHRLGVLPFHFYLTVFGVLLARQTDFRSDDICVGIADSNRKDVSILRSLGLFLNLLPIHFRQRREHSFVDLLRDVKHTTDAAFAHSRIPIDVLLSKLNVPRSRSHSPLFQAFFNYQQFKSGAQTLCGCKASGELVSGGETGYDVSLDIVESKRDETSLSLAVNSNIYTAEDAGVLHRSYLCLLRAFVVNPTTRLALPPLYLEDDIQQAVRVGRGPEQNDSRWPQTICHRIRHMAEMFRDRVALTDGAGHQLTYCEMSARATQTAAGLTRLGVGRGCSVGIFQLPGPDWVCSFLGILQTGACCVPLDRRSGLDRLLLICKDCKPKVIMVDYKTHTEEGFLQNTQASIVQVPDVLSGGEGCELPLNQAKATDAAMITYTSGTTGVPKGSIIRHASYKNFCEFSPPRWPIGLGTETVLQQSSYAFDLSIAQILICVCYGGTLAIISEEQRRDPAAICSLIVRIGVTFTIATPTEYFAWLRHDNGRLLRDSQWRTAITAGEAVTSPLVQAFTSLCRPDIRLVNVYGPSETTIGCADQLILPSLPPSEFGDGLSVLPNYSICIVDADLKPLPIGVPGQILIGGAGVAEGYFKNNKHAASTFMHDNQASASFVANGWVLAHASGDRGRFDSQGRLVLHGRMADSTQIKMGGVRIDLQDIEATIMATSHRIYQAVVSHRVDSVSTREFLVAFLVMSDRQPENAEDSDSDRDTFIERLIRDLPLPQIMRPSIAITVGALPMTISNKIDRLAVDHMPLAEPNRMPGYNNQRDSMLDEFENMLCSLWEEALPADIVRVSRIRDHDADFFVVGGNSLSLLTLQSLIRERLNISIPIMKLFGASTIAQMAALLQDQPSWNSRAAPEMIDWEKETTVRDDFASLPQSDYRQRRQPGQHSSVIILTGSTGFLGQRILGQLVLDSTVSKIHCIAVRKAPRSLHGLFANTKVTVHHGDLRLKQLGLPDHAATAIFAEASAVVHCGANVSFLESYHTLRHTNLASTRELARLSIPYRLPLHYISTASVTQLTRAPAWGAASVAAFPPVIGQLNGFGYKSSKWASERFLERVSEKFGLPVVVHRPTSITGEGASGTDLLGNVMRFARVAKAVPDARGWSGYLDFVGVDTVARKVVGEVAGSVREGREGRDGSGCDIRYVYENGDTAIGVEHLRGYLEGIIGETPSVMSFQGWVDALARAGMNPFLVQYLKGVDGDGGVWLFPKLLTDP